MPSLKTGCPRKSELLPSDLPHFEYAWSGRGREWMEMNIRRNVPLTQFLSTSNRLISHLPSSGSRLRCFLVVRISYQRLLQLRLQAVRHRHQIRKQLRKIQIKKIAL